MFAIRKCATATWQRSRTRSQKTVRRKTDIATRIKADLPGGADVAITKIEASRVSAWLASYDFGPASLNLYLEFARAVFTLAVHDRILAISPIDHLKGKPPAKPVRETPTYEEFQAIVTSIREQIYNADARDSGDLSNSLDWLASDKQKPVR